MQWLLLSNWIQYSHQWTDRIELKIQDSIIIIIIILSCLTSLNSSKPIQKKIL